MAHLWFVFLTLFQHIEAAWPSIDSQVFTWSKETLKASDFAFEHFCRVVAWHTWPDSGKGSGSEACLHALSTPCGPLFGTLGLVNLTLLECVSMPFRNLRLRMYVALMKMVSCVILSLNFQNEPHRFVRLVLVQSVWMNGGCMEFWGTHYLPGSWRSPAKITSLAGSRDRCWGFPVKSLDKNWTMSSFKDCKQVLSDERFRCRAGCRLQAQVPEGSWRFRRVPVQGQVWEGRSTDRYYHLLSIWTLTERIYRCGFHVALFRAKGYIGSQFFSASGVFWRAVALAALQRPPRQGVPEKPVQRRSQDYPIHSGRRL